MSVSEKIKKLAENYQKDLDAKVNQRVQEMKLDNNEHYILYNALGVSNDEGNDIDVFQNKGRFLYKYAGSFIEEAAIICLKDAYQSASTVKVDNTVSPRPKKYEIDCLVNEKDAFEIKWRDATTDGDHINKEHARMRAVASYGYTPIRLMFYKPLRDQAIKIQTKLKTIYENEGGQYYAGKDAFSFLHTYTNNDLEKIIKNIADAREGIK